MIEIIEEHGEDKKNIVKLRIGGKLKNDRDSKKTWRDRDI